MDDASSVIDEAAFREEVRAWLAKNAAEYREPQEWPSDAAQVRASLAWQKKKGEAGYAAPTLPPEMGGRNGVARMGQIFAEEEAKYRIPMFTGLHIGLDMAVPTIRKHGTPEQFRRFATATYMGDAAWCQLFSEPAAGSDLGGIRTRAVRDGDKWIVNGQKVWSSWAHHADWAILLARTDPTVVKHQGLTFFVLDMRTPGVEVRPIRQISGKSDFNETFLTDVVVPDANRIGAEGEGWACAMTVLMNERNGARGSDRSEATGDVSNLIRKARDSGRLGSAAVRARLAQWWVEEQGLKNYSSRIKAATARGETPPPAVAMMKLVSATKLQQTHAFLMDMDEYEGLVSEPVHPEGEEIFFQYIWSSAMRIAGGADEILRNQLAERVLGMPSEPRMDKVPFNELPGIKG
jgi:alkylation response protein AidB-like acyl-CoA dehydrogenase